MSEELSGLIGRRVALRHRLADPGDGPSLTDAVGELADGGPAEVVVHTRRGAIRVRRDAVVAVREIPPPPPRRAPLAAVERLEELCADAWPPLAERRLGRWRLRAAGGFTGRANSTLALGDPGLPLPRALAAVEEFALEHAIPPLLAVPHGSANQRAATALGWRRHDAHPAGADVAVLVANLADLAGLAGEAARTDVEVADRPDADWWRLAEPGPLGAAARHVLTGAGRVPVGFAVARRAGRAVGAARLAVVDGHLHVARLAVNPDERRRGVAVDLMRAASGWAGERDARWCVLQVAEHNTAALALYRRLRFHPHHRYQYLRPG